MRGDNAVLIRGGGDLATGVALRLHRSGMRVAITELPQPLAVRRTVSFSEAVYEGAHIVEGVGSRLIEAHQLSAWEEADCIPVIVDPEANLLTSIGFMVVVDARLLKSRPAPLPAPAPLHIGLGPGFTAGSDCHAVIETRRSHTLGRVYWSGSTQPDSGEPEGDSRRVLRAPANGVITAIKNIGEYCVEGEVVAVIDSEHTATSGSAASGLPSTWNGVHSGGHSHCDNIRTTQSRASRIVYWSRNTVTRRSNSRSR